MSSGFIQVVRCQMCLTFSCSAFLLTFHTFTPISTGPGVPSVSPALPWQTCQASFIGTILCAATHLTSACVVTMWSPPGATGVRTHLARPFLAGAVVSLSSPWLRLLLPLVDRCLPASSRTDLKFLFLVVFLEGMN